MDINLYRNSINNFIYLADQSTSTGGKTDANWSQKSVVIQGYELSVSKTYDIGEGDLLVKLSRDEISGIFDDNTYIYNLKGLNLRTKSKGNSKLDLQFKIFRGDNSDNISSVVPKKIRDDKIIDLIYNKEKFDEFFKENEKLKDIYDTNELLIDFNKIPQNIQDDVSKYIKFKMVE